MHTCRLSEKRAVASTDGMVADCYQFDVKLLDENATRIAIEVKGVSGVAYGVKPGKFVIAAICRIDPVDIARPALARIWKRCQPVGKAQWKPDRHPASLPNETVSNEIHATKPEFRDQAEQGTQTLSHPRAR
jgi:hypothetical protein